MPRINRRDFLKTSAALMAGATFAGASRLLAPRASQDHGKPNILVFVFDAMSAQNLSLYGYERETTPHLSKFARGASVYHRHYAAGNFTTTGTASMLTGLNPWTHRALNYRGMVDRHLSDRNLFKLIGEEYTRVAFTQNLWADILLSQFEADLHIHLPSDSFSDFVHSFVQPDDLPSDRGLAYYAFQDFFNLRVDDPHPFPGSLLIASADLSRALASDRRQISSEYPRGLPTNYDYSYENANLLDGIGHLVKNSLTKAEPYLAYFHLWSPHDPYNPRREFIGLFEEDLQRSGKPQHPLSATSHSEKTLRRNRRQYDEFIADLDAAFGRMIFDLGRTGILQNSYVIVTSDHGELFERGETGHASALMYAPVTHIPLLISAPGQQMRLDFHSVTSNLDLLPTILQIAGSDIPAWVEGKLLPGFGGVEDIDRSIFPLMAKDNPAFQPIHRATFAMIKGGHELLYYTGYPGYPDQYELYHLDEDPDELQNLFTRDITTASHMKDELLEAVNTANRNFQMK
ncbi:MAG TPA: sulfatase-like hydrolase/transferase [Anaerolineales bacterium]|nr:sulfatase-like hydrolase/transferase [Anaerolineales bacterium]